MATLAQSLLILASIVYAQTEVPSSTYDFVSAASSISAFTDSPSFTAYSKPNQKVEEWIALGDSYTAGTGCNGLGEIVAGDAVRGQRSYPMQMSTDTNSWEYINGDSTLPRFTFSAYVGDTTVELVTQQLTQGAFMPNNVNLPRHAMGKPQLAVVTIGGNDAGLGDILNNCIYRGWRPGDCQDTLTTLTNSLNDGTFQQKINVGLWHVANAGRMAGGAQPIQSFQVYVTSYTTFFNQVNPQCNTISWNAWGWGTPALTTALRIQLNGLVTRVNTAIQAAAAELANMGVIYFDGLENEYEGHRYCEVGHTYEQMIDYDTWFWSAYAPQQTTSEGPGDPSLTTTTSAYLNDTQIVLDFLFPNGTVTQDDFSIDNPPWNQPELASKYPDIETLLAAMDDGNVTTYAAPFNYLRSFHPKGTAYGLHAELFFSTIASNRDTVSPQNIISSSTATSATTSPTTSSTATISTTSPTFSEKPLATPQCGPVNGVLIIDADDAQLYLAQEGNGPSDSNCCAGGAISCPQIASNGTALLSLCGGTTQQCTGCLDLAPALYNIIHQCASGNEVAGQVAIPYLNGVTLQLSLNDV